MVPTAGSTLSLVLLVLAVLPDCPRAADCPLLHGDVHSVYYDFNISSKKQPWCMAQGQMDGKYSFSYDCGSDKVISMNLLRGEVMATETWKEQTKTLRDLGNSFKEQLPDITSEILADRGPFTLQAKVTCQRNASGSTCGSWEFGWNGQRVLLFDSESGKYTVDHSRGEQLKEKWEKDKDLTKVFNFTSKGDCSEWLQHLVLWKEEPETTGAAMTTPAAATPSTVPAALSTTSVAIITTSVIFAVVLVLVLIFFRYWFLRSNRRCRSEAPEGVVSSCSPADLQELQSLQQMQRPPEDREDTADAISTSFMA